jgi:hypothetical protein
VLLGWFGRVGYERKLAWKRTALDIPIAIFLALALISCFLAPHPSRSSLGYFWKLLRAVLVFYAVIHSRLGRRWPYLMAAVIVAGGVSSALGVWYYANGAHLGIDYMATIGLEYQDDFKDSGRITEDLRLGLIAQGVKASADAALSSRSHYGDWEITDAPRNRKYAVKRGESGFNIYMIEPRLAGTFKMPNDLGMYLAYVLPLTLGYLVAGWKARRGWKWMAVLGVISSLMLVNLALTLARGAWIGVFVAVVYMLIYIERRWLWALAIGAFLSLAITPQPVKERFQTIYKQPSGFLSERPLWWETSLELIQKHPLTGVGLGRFREEYQRRAPSDVYHRPYHAHNIYLHTAVEQGVPSLILFIWMLVLIFRRLFQLRGAGDFWMQGLFIGASGCLISILVYGLADHVLHQRPLLIFWFLNGMIFYVSGADE